MVEQRGIEPLTSALRTRRSAKLSYCPTRISILGASLEGVNSDAAYDARRETFRIGAEQQGRSRPL
jgi:hypothetical protein